MKTDTVVLATVLAISGLLRVTGSSDQAPVSKPNPVSHRISEKSDNLRGAYPELLARKIQEFYGNFAEQISAGTANLPAHWGVPAGYGRSIKFVIAFVPDPVHTHLGLFFDRSVEALQQAAQHEGYVFDRCVLPWSRASSANAADAETGPARDRETLDREAYPGLLIFRKGQERQEEQAPRGTQRQEGREALFVLLVGESPTAGLRRQQFENALGLMREIQGGNGVDTPKNQVPLLILGPSFSGSLQSLNEELSHLSASKPPVYVYSGSVTGASSIRWFEGASGPNRHFASFQENDDYTLAEFVEFAKSRGYARNEIAVLSEDETVYGAAPYGENQPVDGLVHLHFPREISVFRAAYQKEIAAQQQTASKSIGNLTLPLELDETGSDDDKVAPYGGLQTALSQEAVMLGIVSELQKSHIKFTVLLATDPVDQLFLARYLRIAYPQGRVVVTAPDLLFTREEDTVLHGVLGISSYSMLPGYDNLIAHAEQAVQPPRDDRLFVSSLSVGTYNAMLGLLEIAATPTLGTADGNLLPPAPYAEYGMPRVKNASGAFVNEPMAPLLWLTILGRDGYWPIVGLNGQGLRRRDGRLPVATFPSDGQHSTLKPTDNSPQYPPEQAMHTPASWKLSYCICLLLMFLHAWFSLSGTILSNCESMAQFAVSVNRWRSLILTIGGWLLTTELALILCTRNPLLAWRGGTGLTLALWVPLPLFAALLAWDLAARREAVGVAIGFLIAVAITVSCQVLLVCVPSPWLQNHSVYWSTRVLQLGSGVSPVPPVLLLLCAGYWWVWFALRGVALMDLRRPRLPQAQDLPMESTRISDREAEKLRLTAHPLFFSGVALIPLVALAIILLTILDLRHPLQTLEGWLYDCGYTAVLGLVVAAFVGCLIKLVCTWLECQQILAGLDRLPIREAFTRMKELSWRSLWTPGGSTLRETYKVLSRAIETMVRLEGVIEEKDMALTPEARSRAREAIKNALQGRQITLNLYAGIFEDKPCGDKGQSVGEGAAQERAGIGADRTRPWRIFAEGRDLDALARSVEELQKLLAKAAAVLIEHVLRPLWSEETAPVVSEDTRITRPPLQPVRGLAEELVALIYVNFLVSVLLRIRTMVIGAAGMYVFIVCSISVYPFEPYPALQTLSVGVLLLMAAVVGYVYAEMHRDAILSRLTATQAGHLGLDFWLKFVSAGAIPVLSLLAVQFPEINQLFFSWLEPALQALK